MKLWRAINRRELAQILARNKCDKGELSVGKSYSFFIYKDTIWVNRHGATRWNLKDIARNEPDKCGIIVSLSRWWLRGFTENPADPGKYYCQKDRIDNVKIEFHE